MSEETLKPKFGDVIENGWASLDNPTRVGFFVREGHRTGRMNPGRYFEVTDGKGKFWELSATGEHKITIVKPASAFAAIANQIHALTGARSVTVMEMDPFDETLPANPVKEGE